MDKIKLLKQRRDTLKSAGKSIRADIVSLTDENSFVELSAFSFSKDAFYGEDAHGEGVVTGFAAVGGYPFYIVAQNFEQSYGGLTKAGCEKIVKTIAQAEKNGTSVIYLLHSYGVRVGEGVETLEGISSLLLKASQASNVTQIAVLCGEVYGSTAALASLCDFVLFAPKSALSIASPLVLSAKAGKNLKPEEVGGYAALKNSLLPAIEVKDLKDAARKIQDIRALLNEPVIDAELNAPVPALNKTCGAAELVKTLEGAIELGASSCPQVKTVLGRMGGIAVAAVLLDNVALDAACMRKINDFTKLSYGYDLPLVLFVDCVGVQQSLSVNDSTLLKEIGRYFRLLDELETPKISVVTGKAIGLGYSLFAAKSAGFDYAVSFANAQIALFESAAGAQIEYANDKRADQTKLQTLYAEEVADPFNAAKGGYIDDIIEPQFVKQYLIASLQTLAR